MDIEVLDVVKPGSKVFIGHENDNVKATILEVCISSNNRIQYKVTWWSARERHEAWIETCEIFQLVKGSSVGIKIGFANV